MEGRPPRRRRRSGVGRSLEERTSVRGRWRFGPWPGSARTPKKSYRPSPPPWSAADAATRRSAADALEYIGAAATSPRLVERLQDANAGAGCCGRHAAWANRPERQGRPAWRSRSPPATTTIRSVYTRRAALAVDRLALERHRRFYRGSKAEPTPTFAGRRPHCCCKFAIGSRTPLPAMSPFSKPSSHHPLRLRAAGEALQGLDGKVVEVLPILAVGPRGRRRSRSRQCPGDPGASRPFSQGRPAGIDGRFSDAAIARPAGRRQPGRPRRAIPPLLEVYRSDNFTLSLPGRPGGIGRMGRTPPQSRTADARRPGPARSLRPRCGVSGTHRAELPRRRTGPGKGRRGRKRPCGSQPSPPSATPAPAAKDSASALLYPPSGTRTKASGRRRSWYSRKSASTRAALPVLSDAVKDADDAVARAAHRAAARPRPANRRGRGRTHGQQDNEMAGYVLGYIAARDEEAIPRPRPTAARPESADAVAGLTRTVLDRPRREARGSRPDGTFEAA